MEADTVGPWSTALQITNGMVTTGSYPDSGMCETSSGIDNLQEMGKAVPCTRRWGKKNIGSAGN